MQSRNPQGSYAIKRWWRAAREEGESLKAFARRHAAGTTAALWLERKRKHRGTR